MKHDYTDYLNEDELQDAMRDERYAPFEAGFNKAKEIYASPNPGQLAFITSALDHFLWWREVQDAGNQRMDV